MGKILSSKTTKLELNHDYRWFADSCRNCKHFTHANNTEDSDKHLCHVDAGVFDSDGYLNTNQQVHELERPWGVCNKHERTNVRYDK